MFSESYLRPNEIRSAAVIGAGSVGAGWVASFLAHGMSVIVHDPSPTAEDRARALVARAWPALHALDVVQSESPPQDRLRFVATAAEAASLADVVQENVLEQLDVKRRVLEEIGEAAAADKIVMSSTGGMLPSMLQSFCRHPQRFVVVHPFNPVHLIPLVEVVGGKQTSSATIDWAMDFARFLGKKPIRLTAEASGHMTNRLQFALFREAVACLLDGVASARDIDMAVRYGLGPRWMLMGSLLSVHLAGGPGGMRGILDHAGAAIEDWWTPTSTLGLTEDVKMRLVAAGDELAAGQSVSDWVSWRDRNLVDVLKLQQAIVR